MLNIKKMAKKINNKLKLSHIIYGMIYKCTKVDENIILYESFYGRSMSCNPYALFKSFMMRDDFKNYQHIWIINNRKGNKEIYAEYKHIPNIKFIKISSLRYLSFLSKAKYLINNSTFPAYFIKKNQQIYINTWHGIPLKHMGYDMPNGNIGSANTVRNFLSCDYLLSPNSFHTKIYTEVYKLEGIFEGKIIEEGQSRTDTILKSNKDYILDKLQKKGINIQSDKTVILYAPTWKGINFSNPVIDINSFIDFFEHMERNLDSSKYQILIKPHQAVYNKLIKTSPAALNRFIPYTVDTNELLSVVDILISDYSSIFFDFLVTDRPILFFISDLEDYQNYRGTYFDTTDLPGPATNNLDELCSYILNINQVKVKYRHLYDKTKNWSCQYDDGSVSERILEIIFDKECGQKNIFHTNNTKQKLLFYAGGMRINGITYSFLSLLNHLDYEKYDVTVLVGNTKNKICQELINKINNKARVLVRIGIWNATAIETIRKNLVYLLGLDSNYLKKIFPKQLFQREYRRLFGKTKFDSVIDFSGYSPFWALLLLQADGSQKFIWLHNDMLADKNRYVNGKKPYYRGLKTIISIYPQFDGIISCSQSVRDVNKKNLATKDTESKFIYAKNTLYFQRIQECLSISEITSIEDLMQTKKGRNIEKTDLPSKCNTNFVTMGRLSTEKNHVNLIKAFKEVVKTNSSIHLYIIGDGPLKDDLEQLIQQLNLQDIITLTGNLANPFFLMNRCDCFILPSFHEGQPLVILEARMLGLPIIVSNFSSVKDSLIENGQYLIGTSMEDIYDGVMAFIENKVPDYHFDPVLYNKQAIREFEAAINELSTS